MNERFLPVVIAALALALAGCQSPQPIQNASPDTSKQLRVEHVRLEHAPSFAPGSADLSAAEVSRLEAFLDQAAVRPEERLYIAPPREDALAPQRISSIVKVLAERGIGAETIEPAASGAAAGADRYRILVDRYTVQTPKCPDWSGPSANDHDNFPGSNFGCATFSNLGMMVDNPRDLEIGQTLGPADAQPAADAVERYRTGNLKPIFPNSGGGGGQGGQTFTVSSGASGGGGGSGGGSQ